MKEKLVTFETAKLAKEAGFNEDCSHYYIKAFNSSFKDKDGDLGKFKIFDGECELNNALRFRKNSKGQPHLVIAPTQSALQQWLREEKGVHIEIRHATQLWKTLYSKVHKDRECFTYYFIIVMLESEEDFQDPEHNTYENYHDCLEDALFHSLKNIWI